MNRPHFCYVLTTTALDRFADLTYASAAFLRHAYPESKITCLCDALSHRALEEARHPLLELVDRALAVETPDGPPGYRNRCVKTRMRQLLEGDFVYLDSDTLVVDRIDELLACPAPVAGVVNNGASWKDGTDNLVSMADGERNVFYIMNWQLPSRPYINAGVLFLRDCEATHRFARLWHEKWLDCSRWGQQTDQQSLNSALADSGIDYEVLGSRFNAQVNRRPRVCLEPVAVWHFFPSHSDQNGIGIPKTMLDEAIARFRAEGCLRPDVIRELREWPYPWRTPTMLDRWFVRRYVLHRDNLPEHSASRYWLAGHRRKAVMKYLSAFGEANSKRIEWRIIRPALSPARRLFGAVCLLYNGGIGDHLMLSTVARELKRSGQRRVFIVTPYPELFLHNADVDGAATPGTNRSRLFMHSSQRVLWPDWFTYLINHDPIADTRDPPPEPALACLCRLAGVGGRVDLRPYIALSESERAHGAPYRGCIAIQSSGLGSGVPALNKQWYPERFAEVAAHLLAHHPVVQVGLATDPPVPCTYDLRGKLALRDLAAVLTHCRMFVGLEGMPMHMARAVDCPSVIVYGGRLRPDQIGYTCNENLYSPLICSPCWRDSLCDFGRACLESITSQDVIAAAERLLERPREGLAVESYELRSARETGGIAE